VCLWIHEHNPTCRVECTNDLSTCIPCRLRLITDNIVTYGQEVPRNCSGALGYSVLLRYLVLDVTRYLKSIKNVSIN